MNRFVGRTLCGVFGALWRCTGRAQGAAPRRILVVKTHAIGDLLMVTPSITALRRLFPDAYIACLTGRWSAPVLVNSPDVDELISFRDELLFEHKVSSLLRLAKDLRAKRFDLAAIFQASAAIHTLIALAGVPQRIGFDLNGSGFSLTTRLTWSPSSDRFIGDNYMDLARNLGFQGAGPPPVLALSDNEREEAVKKHLAHHADPDARLIAICPGGGKNPRDAVSAKLWPAGHFAKVASMLAEETGAKIIVLGGPGDDDVLEAVIETMPLEPIRPAGTSVRELAALLSLCCLVITNDSAPVHIAAALGVPCVAVYGPSNPLSVAPRVPTHYVVKSPAGCSPCYSNMKFPGCDAPFCMSLIEVDEVLDQARKALSQEGQA